MKNQLKKHIIRRLSAVILSAVLVFCIVPMSVSVSAVSLDNGFKYETYDAGVIIIEYTGSETEVVIPQEIDGYPVTMIYDHAFSCCYDLESITIPDSVIIIGHGAFSHCFNLTNVTISGGVTSIDNLAFAACSSLESITIPDSVTSIGSEAFRYCSSLESITIPDSVTTIYNLAFYQCQNLTTVYYYGTEEQWNQIKIGSYNASLKNANIIFVEEEAPVYEKGDLDGDGELSATDSLLMKQYLAARISLESFFDPSLADLNGDGAINIKDHFMLRIALAS